MARLFDDASTHYLENAAAVLTAYPFTMAAWAKSNDATVLQTVMGLGNAAAGSPYHVLQFAGATVGDPIVYRMNEGTGQVLSTTSTGYTANTWHHVCAVGRSATSRDVYIDGGSKGSEATNRAFGTCTRTAIGRRTLLTPSNYFSGDIAEAAFWSTDLTDAEVALLAKPVSPLLIRPDALVAYWPLGGNFSPEIDLIGKFDLTVTSATKSAHPRVYYPAPTWTPFIAAAAGGDPEGSLVGGKLLRGGLLLHGVLGR